MDHVADTGLFCQSIRFFRAYSRHNSPFVSASQHFVIYQKTEAPEHFFLLKINAFNGEQVGDSFACDKVVHKLFYN